MLKQGACHDSFKVIIANIARALPVHCCYQFSDITAACLQHRHALGLGCNAFNLAFVLHICLLHTETMVTAVVCNSVAVSWQREKNMVLILSPQCLEAEKHLLGYPHSACQSFLCPAARSSPESLVFVALSRSLHQQATTYLCIGS